MNLPSERFRAGDARPIGFQDDLTPSHIERTISALTELAEAISTEDHGDGEHLRACLTSVPFMPGLPFNLYGFALYDVDEFGRVVADPVTGEVSYAITANLPVDLQREAAISMFFQFLGRQKLVATAMQDRAVFAELGVRALSADQEWSKLAGSELRGNWRAAVASLQSEASAGSTRLTVRYRTDPFPTRDDVVRRIPALRRAYNELEFVRGAVDRLVAAFGANRWSISGGDEKTRLFVQERLEVMQISRYVAQTVRDAYVCGNGYMSLSSRGTAPRIRILRPESVELRNGRFYEHTQEGQHDVTQGLLHHRGMEQLRSQYGMSPLEIALSALQSQDQLAELREQAGRFRRQGLRVDQLRELQESEEMSEAAHAQAMDRLRPIFGFFVDQLPDPPANLYFPGQERVV